MSDDNVSGAGSFNADLTGTHVNPSAADPEPPAFVRLSIGLLGLGALGVKARRRSA